MRTFFVAAMISSLALCTWGCEISGSLTGEGGDGSLTSVSGTIDTNTTWRAEQCPANVVGDLYVQGPANPVLRIEAGCEVRGDADKGLYVSYNDEGGGLEVAGTAQQPVVFTSAGNEAPGAWAGIAIHDNALQGKLAFVHARVEYAGGAYLSGGLEVKGATVKVVSSSFNSSEEDGIYLDGGAGFTPDSSAISARGNKGYGISTPPKGAMTIPAGGTFADNVVAPVELRGGTFGASGSIRDLDPGDDYVVSGDLYVQGASSPVLTIAAGASLAFAADKGLYVGYSGEPGGLLIDGAAGKQVSLTGRVADPGSWAGVALYPSTLDAKSAIRHAVLRHGGGAYLGANLSLLGASVIVADSTFEASEEHGIELDKDGRLAEGSGAITARDNAGYGVSASAENAHTVPESGVYTGNKAAAVQIRGGTIGQTASWGPIGAPYRVTGDLYVQGDAKPTLAIEAGTTLEFAADTGLYVAYNDKPGALALNGSKDKPVLLTAVNPSDPWAGVQLHKNTIDAATKLAHATLEIAGGAYLDANLVLQDATPAFEALTLRKSDEYGLSWTCGSKPDLTKIEFSDNKSGDKKAPKGC